MPSDQKILVPAYFDPGTCPCVAVLLDGFDDDLDL